MAAGADADLTRFDDGETVSEYAAAAMRWACGIGLMQGRGEKTLAPQGTATRAEAAAVFMRLAEYMAK